MLLFELALLSQLLVQILLELAAAFIDGTALDALVRKIEGLAVNRQYADEPTLDHAVEVAAPRLHRLFGRDAELLTLLGFGG